MTSFEYLFNSLSLWFMTLSGASNGSVFYSRSSWFKECFINLDLYFKLSTLIKT